MEAQGAAAGAMPTVPVTVKDFLTRVIPSLERLENAVTQSATTEAEVRKLHPVVLEMRSRKSKSAHPKSSKKSL